MQKKDKLYLFMTSAGSLKTYCGVSESLFLIVNNFTSRRMVITGGVNGITPKLAKYGIPVRVLKIPVERMSSRKKTFTNYLYVLLSLVKYNIGLSTFLITHRCSCVYIADITCAFFSILLLKLFRVRIIFGIRGRPGDGRWWQIIYKCSDLLIPLSRDLANIAMKCSWYPVSDRIRVIPNGIDPELRNDRSESAIRDELRLNEQDVLVLYPGLFDERKGQLAFIQNIFPILAVHEKIKNYCIVFVGCAKNEKCLDYYNACIKAADNYPLVKCYFLGFRDKLHRIYKKSDIVLLASLSEGQPRVLLEAMAQGIAVISFGIESVHELLGKNERGMIVKPFDYQEFADKLLHLVDNPKERYELGSSAYQYITDNFQIKEIVRRYEDVFRSICDN